MALGRTVAYGAMTQRTVGVLVQLQAPSRNHNRNHRTHRPQAAMLVVIVYQYGRGFG